MSKGKNIEKEIFNNFLSESADLLRELENSVIGLEKSPDSRESVDNIFRCVHSLKGGSALFGFSGIKLFTHTLENMIDRIRQRKLDADTGIIDLILRGTDHLKSMFARLVDDEKKADLSPDEEQFMEELASLLETKESGKSSEAEEEQLHDELMKFLDRSDVKEELEDNKSLNEIIDIIKKNSPKLLEERRVSPAKRLLYDGMDISREYYAIKSAIEEVRGGKPAVQAEMVFNSIDSLLKKHGENSLTKPIPLLEELMEELQIVYQDENGFDELLADITSEAIAKYDEMLKNATAATSTPTSEETDRTEPPLKQRKRQVKVDQTKLDEAISMIGELVTVSEFFNFLQIQILQGNIESNVKNLKDAISALQGLSETLARHLYEIRKVPINEATQRLPRMVRDEQTRSGKKVRLMMKGEETLVDKSLVSKLETIFVHMIRNSMDHGIELPEARLKAGKPKEGTILLDVKADDAKMVVKIEDDGQGIDIEKLKEKAVQTGVIKPEETESLSEQELVEKILTPGFSMSEKITETSGRGVGMDIVNSCLAEMDGIMKVENFPQRGITITLTIPLTHTTLVKKGFAVAVGSNVFLIPIEAVLESFQPANGEISSIEGGGEIINRRGDIIKLIRLHKLFNIKKALTDPGNAILVTVWYKNKKVCFMVDYVIGQRQIIYKKLAVQTQRKPSPFEGVSVYDGNRLAMILDVDGIMGQA